MLLLGVPALIALVYFLLRIVPASLTWLFPHNMAQRMTVAAITMFALFGFYGAVGFLEGGEIARRLSTISVLGLVPAMTALEFAILWRRRKIAAPL